MSVWMGTRTDDSRVPELQKAVKACFQDHLKDAPELAAFPGVNGKIYRHEDGREAALFKKTGVFLIVFNGEAFNYPDNARFDFRGFCAFEFDQTGDFLTRTTVSNESYEMVLAWARIVSKWPRIEYESNAQLPR